MKFPSLAILAALLIPSMGYASGGGDDSQVAAAPTTESPRIPPPRILEQMARWICKKADHVCGLDDARILSNPAEIDYQGALDETPSILELKRKGIDPNSPEGIQLRTKGQDELKEAAKSVMEGAGHCSVWKKIRNTDGRKVPDITQDVKDRLGQG